MENAALVPFAYRRQLGIWRAYWTTVGQVILRRKQFVAGIEHPVSFSDARLFWQITLLLATIPTAGALMVAFATLSIFAKPLSGQTQSFQLLDLAWYAVLIVCCWVFFFILTTIPSCISFISNHANAERQDRAIALSSYAAAPFAWTFVPAALLLTAKFVGSASWADSRFGQVLFWSLDLMGALAVIMQSTFWINAIGELIEAFRRGPRYLIFIQTFAVVVVALITSLFFAFVVIPLIYGNVAVLIDSLR